MMIKLNQTLNISNTNEIPRLPDDTWNRSWPRNRPALPANYLAALETDAQLFEEQRQQDEQELQGQNELEALNQETSDDDEDEN
jgi:uncharacterized protein with NRDE domain